MMAADDRRRRDALVDLVDLRVSLSAAIAATKQLPWDSDVEQVLLSRANVVGLLARYLRRELSSDDLEAWANAVEGREDIGVEPHDAEMLRKFIFEFANPELAHPISDSSVHRWLNRLSDKD